MILKKGSGCAKCVGHCPIQAQEDYYLQAQERGYQILGSYVDSKITIQMRCPESHLLEIAPCSFKGGRGFVPNVPTYAQSKPKRTCIYKL